MIRKDADVIRGIAGALVGFIAAGTLGFAGAQPPKGDGKDAKKDPPKAEDKAAPAPEFKSSKEKGCFAIGFHLGKQMLKDFGRADAVDTDLFLKGLKSGLAGEAGMTDSAIRTAIVDYRIDVIKEDAARFLEANKKKEGVKTTPSGLEYEVLKAGDPNGKKPSETSTVKVHYTGTLINGTKFDSSVDRGEPASFAVNGVIKGWTEALQLMHVGDKWRLFIPPEIAYGAKGSPPAVPPHAVLIFEVELLDVK